MHAGTYLGIRSRLQISCFYKITVDIFKWKITRGLFQEVLLNTIGLKFHLQAIKADTCTTARGSYTN